MMTLPFSFATQPGPIPLQELDANFNAVAALGVVPCTAVGTNAITLTPQANSPDISAYANYLRFGFVAAATATNAVTIQVNALSLVPLFLSDGVTQAVSGGILNGVYYDIVYNSALNGFQIVSAMAVNQLLNLISSMQGSLLTRGPSSWVAISAGSQNSVLTMTTSSAAGWAASAPVAIFTSSQQSITSAGSLTIAHSLSAIPNYVAIKLHCITGEHGYTTGNEFFTNPSVLDNVNSAGLVVVPDAINLNVRYGSNATPIIVANFSTGSTTALTNVNWSTIFIAAVIL